MSSIKKALFLFDYIYWALKKVLFKERLLLLQSLKVTILIILLKFKESFYSGHSLNVIESSHIYPGDGYFNSLDENALSFQRY